MAFRLMRICSDEETFERRLLELKNDFLLPRNYHSKIIDSQFKRVRNLPGEKERRKLALQKNEKKKEDRSDRVIAPIDFNPLLPKISDVFVKHYTVLE